MRGAHKPLHSSQLGSVSARITCRTPERLRQHTRSVCTRPRPRAHMRPAANVAASLCRAHERWQATRHGPPARHYSQNARGAVGREAPLDLAVGHARVGEEVHEAAARRVPERCVCRVGAGQWRVSVRGVKAARGCRSKAAVQSYAACPSSHVPSDKVGARSPLECRDTEKHPVPVPELHRSKDARIGRCKAKSAWRWRGAAVAGVRRQRPPSWRSHRVREGCTHGAPPSLWVGPAPDTGPPRPRWPGARMCAAATCAAAVPDPTRGKALDTHPPTSPITRFT